MWCAKFHGNLSAHYRDNATREIGVNGRTPDGRTHGIPENIMPLATYCWRRRHKQFCNKSRPCTREQDTQTRFIGCRDLGCVKLLSQKVRFSYLLQQHVHFLDVLRQQIAESYTFLLSNLTQLFILTRWFLYSYCVACKWRYPPFVTLILNKFDLPVCRCVCIPRNITMPHLRV